MSWCWYLIGFAFNPKKILPNSRMKFFRQFRQRHMQYINVKIVAMISCGMPNRTHTHYSCFYMRFKIITVIVINFIFSPCQTKLPDCLFIDRYDTVQLQVTPYCWSESWFKTNFEGGVSYKKISNQGESWRNERKKERRADLCDTPDVYFVASPAVLLFLLYWGWFLTQKTFQLKSFYLVII